MLDKKKCLKHIKGQYRNIPNVALCSQHTGYFAKFTFVFFALRQDAPGFYIMKSKLKFTCTVGFLKEQFYTKNFENNMTVWH